MEASQVTGTRKRATDNEAQSKRFIDSARVLEAEGADFDKALELVLSKPVRGDDTAKGRPRKAR